ncbi:MAG: iron-sulfur cluster insertion protein ErpA [Candidatus Dasytiphilus stammeri]
MKIDTFNFPLNFTSAATSKIKNLIFKENKANLKFRIYIQGGGCSGFKYGFLFDEHIKSDDLIIEKFGISVVIDPMSLQYLIGSSIDYIEQLQGSRFIVNNPNTKTTCSCGLSFSPY